jgi:hypothetical protein
MIIAILLSGATLALAEGKPQTHCPVMGGKINPKQYVDVNGYRIYVCCKPCTAQVKANPDKYIEQMQAAGLELEKAPKAAKQEAGKK